MGRPTLAAQLAKAAADGDMEKVKELAVRLEKSDSKKPKPKPKLKKTKTNEDKIKYNDFIAPSQGNDRKVDIDSDGRVRSRIVPFKIIKNRKNGWKDDETKDAADIKFDKLVHKNKNKKRQYREPTKKIEVRCDRCKELKLVWPGDIFHRNWVCDECLIRPDKVK